MLLAKTVAWAFGTITVVGLIALAVLVVACVRRAPDGDHD